MGITPDLYPKGELLHRGYILHLHKLSTYISLLAKNIKEENISFLTNQNGEGINISRKYHLGRRWK